MKKTNFDPKIGAGSGCPVDLEKSVVKVDRSYPDNNGNRISRFKTIGNVRLTGKADGLRINIDHHLAETIIQLTRAGDGRTQPEALYIYETTEKKEEASNG